MLKGIRLWPHKESIVIPGVPVVGFISTADRRQSWLGSTTCWKPVELVEETSQILAEVASGSILPVVIVLVYITVVVGGLEPYIVFVRVIPIVRSTIGFI